MSSEQGEHTGLLRTRTGQRCPRQAWPNDRLHPVLGQPAAPTGAWEGTWALPLSPRGCLGATSTWDPLQHMDDSVSRGHWPAWAALVFWVPLPLGREPGICEGYAAPLRRGGSTHSPGHMTASHVEPLLLLLLLRNPLRARPRLPAPGMWTLSSPQSSPPCPAPSHSCSPRPTAPPCPCLCPPGEQRLGLAGAQRSSGRHLPGAACPSSSRGRDALGPAAKPHAAEREARSQGCPRTRPDPVCPTSPSPCSPGRRHEKGVLCLINCLHLAENHFGRYLRHR